MSRGTSGRSAVTWAALGAELHRLLGAEPPVWMRARTVEAAQRLLTLLAADAARATGGLTREAQAEALGAGARTLKRWVAARGWLAETDAAKKSSEDD